jgi:hypothetical protein
MAKSFYPTKILINAFDHTIVEGEPATGKKVGLLRVQPNAIAWKPSGKKKMKRATLEKFVEWIMQSGEDREQ